MYKGKHEKMQRKADGLVGAPVSAESLQMNEDEQHEMLKKELQAVELKILRGEGNKKLLGKRKFVLQAQMQRLKPKIKKMNQLGQIFMEEARRLLPREQYNKIYEQSCHVWRIRNPATRNDPISDQTYTQAEMLGVEI